MPFLTSPTLAADGVTIDETAGVLSLTNGGSMRLHSQTILGSAGTTITVSGLDTDADGVYFMVAQVTTATTDKISLFANGDTTATNYYSQKYEFSNTSLSAWRTNTAEICSGFGEVGMIIGYIGCTASDYYEVCITHANGDAPTAISQAGSHVKSKNALAAGKLTSISLVSSANFAIGSKITLYKVGK